MAGILLFVEKSKYIYYIIIMKENKKSDKKKVDSKHLEEEMARFSNKLTDSQEETDQEIMKLINEKFWDLI